MIIAVLVIMSVLCFLYTSTSIYSRPVIHYKIWYSSRCHDPLHHGGAATVIICGMRLWTAVRAVRTSTCMTPRTSWGCGMLYCWSGSVMSGISVKSAPQLKLACPSQQEKTNNPRTFSELNQRRRHDTRLCGTAGESCL
jgi:hypothetical protein